MNCFYESSTGLQNITPIIGKFQFNGKN